MNRSDGRINVGNWQDGKDSLGQITRASATVRAARSARSRSQKNHDETIRPRDLRKFSRGTSRRIRADRARDRVYRDEKTIGRLRDYRSDCGPRSGLEEGRGEGRETTCRYQNFLTRTPVRPDSGRVYVCVCVCVLPAPPFPLVPPPPPSAVGSGRTLNATRISPLKPHRD